MIIERSRFKHIVLLALLILLQLGVISCTAGKKAYFHSFSFDTLLDGQKYGVPDVDILDWVYGDGTNIYLKLDPYFARVGRYDPATDTTGMFPRGESLYVKWRDKKSGNIYEDRVDLRNRIPQDLTGYGIHFVAFESQLYVFLVPPPKSSWDRKYWTNPDLRRKYQIYP